MYLFCFNIFVSSKKIKKKTLKNFNFNLKKKIRKKKTKKNKKQKNV